MVMGMAGGRSTGLPSIRFRMRSLEFIMVLQTLTAQKGKFVTHSERHELDGQRLVAHHAGVSYLVFNPLFRLQHPDDGDALGAFLEQRPEEQSRVKCTEAEARAEAEGEGRIGPSVQAAFAPR